jgi:hypothetical protein
VAIGFVKIQRGDSENELSRYGFMLEGFRTWLALNANKKAAKFHDEWVHPGSKIVTLQELANTGKCTVKVIRRMLNILETEGILKKDSRANQWTKLSLCDWHTYNDLPCWKGKLKAHTRANRGYTNKEVKKSKNLILYRACWKKFGEYGNEERGLECWSELSEADQQTIEKKIPVYLEHLRSTKQRKKFFENWIKDRDWKTSYGNGKKDDDDDNEISFSIE